MLSRAIEKSWAGRGALPCLLYPLSLLFGLVAALRRWAYRLGFFKSVSLPVPVVVVGNITVGGSGKTPLVISLAGSLQRAGFTPGIVSRGHLGAHAEAGATSSRVREADAKRYGDEAVLIAARTGMAVFVGSDRVATARSLLAEQPEVDLILSDDGLQHYRLQRDLEIAVFDARGVGNGWLLPAGPLREPRSRLERVDAIVLNTDGNANDNVDQSGAALPNLPRNIPAFRMRLVGVHAQRVHAPRETRELSDFAGMDLLAAAGIGNPERFFSLLRTAGLRFEPMPLPDHYDFKINPFASSAAEAILVTEKDAVKCGAIDDSRLWCVPVTAEIESGLVPLIVEIIGRQHRRARHSVPEKDIGPSPA